VPRSVFGTLCHPHGTPAQGQSARIAGSPGTRSSGRRVLFGVLIFALGHAGYACAAEVNDDIWSRLRSSLFADRAIVEQAQDVIELTAPVRAEDAAAVPISIRTKGTTGERGVEKIYLIIDRNPSPLGAVFSFSAASGRADIETRVRIEDYTAVRAIAEFADGRLFMSTRFVKASGGCSAPIAADREAALLRLGRVKLRLGDPVTMDQPNLAQLLVSHPNNSGLVMDQLTRLFIPARFVRRIEVSYAGQPVLSADVDFTLSENPNLRFYFLPHEPGELKATVVDTSDARFEAIAPVRPAAGQ
jgi:sulfur-oxidizing protein SoxY